MVTYQWNESSPLETRDMKNEQVSKNMMQFLKNGKEHVEQESSFMHGLLFQMYARSLFIYIQFNVQGH